MPLSRLLLLAACLWSCAAGAAEMLTVEALSGKAIIEREGEKSALKVGDVLAERDRLTLADGATLALRLGRHGRMELGGGAQLVTEKLPFASYAADLRSVLNLQNGYLRVVWKHPSTSANWPLYVALGDYRASLASGEYFFENARGSQAVCNAEGQVGLSSSGSVETRTLEPDACYRLGRGPLQPIARQPEDWVPVRLAYALGNLADPREAATTVAAAPEVPPQQQPPARTPRPIIRTAPVEDSSPMAAPKSIAPPPAEVVALPPPAPVEPPVVRPPPPEPVAVAAPAVASGTWILNVVSFPEKAKAEQQQQRLRDNGYSAVITSAEVKRATWYRVQLPGMTSVEQAKAVASELETRLGYKGAWVIRVP